jgi:hypothetical protein
MKTVFRILPICLVAVSFIFPCSAEEFRFPLDGFWEVLQDFGVWNSIADGYHLAEDAAASTGASVLSSADGVVKFADVVVEYKDSKIVGGYSGLVIIEHKEVCTLYGHLGKATLKAFPGQQIKKGTLLGYIADPTEYSDDPNMPSHIHFGVHNGKYTDERFCDRWAYVGYSQECIGMTHEQYMTMWTNPTDYICSHTPPSQIFKAGDNVKVLPDIGLKLRDTHQITPDDSNKIALMRKDAVVTILAHADNGIAEDRYYWWYVQYSDEKGWCAEADRQRSETYLSLTSELVTPPRVAAKIKVEEADVVWEKGLTPSTGLATAARTVSPRVIVEYADSIFSSGLTGAEGLTEAGKSVLPRIVIEYADSLFSQKIEKPEGMENAAKAVTPRIIVEYADSAFSRPLLEFSMGGATERVLSITSAEAPAGTSVALHLSITDATGVAGADIVIKYDANVLTIGEIQGTELASGLSLIVNKDVPGEITIGMAGMPGISSGSGALVGIGLAVNADAQAGTETILSFGGADVYDESGAVIPVSLENGAVKIIEPVGIKGDVSDDGKIGANDAILALRIATGLITPTDEQKWAADMNGDGKVGSNDAIIILRRAAGLAAPGKGVIASAGGPITVTLAEVHGVAGESVIVPLKVDNPLAPFSKGDNVAGLAGGDICIVYDSAVLRAVDVSSDSDMLLASNVAEAGLVRIAFANDDRPNSKTLLKVEFNILADDVSPLMLKSIELYGPDALPMDWRKSDGKFSSWAIPPEHSALLQNFPNPFNPDTWIPYQLKEASEVTIQIFSAPGDLIRELNLGYKPAGLYVSRDRAAYWDGTNASGEKVASGVYFYSIRAGDFSAVGKLIILK